MRNNYVNEIFQNIKDNTISIEIACKKLIEYIFKNPIHFGLSNMGEDENSEFLLYLFEHLDRVIENYSEEISSFSTYLVNVIHRKKCAWYREHYQKMARVASVQQYYITEEAQYFCEDSVLYNTEKQYQCTAKIDKNHALTFLILALKSCYFLTQRHINLLSLQTGYSEDYIHSLIEYLEKCIHKKIEDNCHRKERIYGTYIKKNSCIYELMHVDSSSTMYERLRSKHTLYTCYWNKYISKYKNIKSIKPSNIQIANALNIKVHVVSRILRDAKEIKEKTFV